MWWPVGGWIPEIECIPTEGTNIAAKSPVWALTLKERAPQTITIPVEFITITPRDTEDGK